MKRIIILSLVAFLNITAFQSVSAQSEYQTGIDAFLKAYETFSQQLQQELVNANATALVETFAADESLTFHNLRKAGVFSEEIEELAGNAFKHFSSITTVLDADEKEALYADIFNTKVNKSFINAFSETNVRAIKSSLNVREACNDSVQKLQMNASAGKLIEYIDNLSSGKTAFNMNEYSAAILRFTFNTLALRLACQ